MRSPARRISDQGDGRRRVTRRRSWASASSAARARCSSASVSPSSRRSSPRRRAHWASKDGAAIRTARSSAPRRWVAGGGSVAEQAIEAAEVEVDGWTGRDGPVAGEQPRERPQLLPQLGGELAVAQLAGELGGRDRLGDPVPVLDRPLDARRAQHRPRLVVPAHLHEDLRVEVGDQHPFVADPHAEPRQHLVEPALLAPDVEQHREHALLAAPPQRRGPAQLVGALVARLGLVEPALDRGGAAGR